MRIWSIYRTIKPASNSARACLPIRQPQYFRIFEVMRDYGMYERTEAPQYYPPVKREQVP